MGKKILITSGPFVRAVEEKSGRLKAATDILDQAGIEYSFMLKPANQYTLEDFRPVMPRVQAVIAGGEKWNEDMFKLSPNLKLVARFGVGFDAVDIKTAKNYNIFCTNTQVHELSNGVAELGLGMILAVYRNICLCDADMKKGVWKTMTGNQIQGKTVGIVGFGAIGRCFATLLQGFGCRIVACDPYANMEAAKKLNTEIVDMDRLLAESDIVSLNAPNTPENHHMFNAAAFAKMKKGSVFVNTARGPMVDEKALYKVLTDGHLLGAGIDVWETEPTPSDNPLSKLPNVVALPHNAGENRESSLAIAVCCARQVVDALSGKKPEFLLNP